MQIPASPVQVIPLKKVQLSEVYPLVYRAFFDYPLCTYVFPDVALRQRVLTWYMGYAIRFSLRYGEVYSTPEREGVAGWVAPETHLFNLWLHLRNGILQEAWRYGLKALRLSQAYDAYAEKAHKASVSGSHWYLFLLGVDPSCQGRGIGGALLQPVLERADQAGLPCYLETHAPHNLAFYARYGFEVAQAGPMPGTDLPFWGLLRKPQARQQ